MRNVVKPALAVVLFGTALAIGWQFLPHQEARKVPAGAQPELTEAARRELAPWRKRVARADAVAAADVLREARRDVLGQEAQAALVAWSVELGQHALKQAQREIDDACTRYQYVTARRAAERYRRAWATFPVHAEMAKLPAAVVAEADATIGRRIREADDLLRRGRPDAAREALAVQLELDEAHQQRWNDAIAALDRRIRVHDWKQARGTKAPGVNPGARPPAPSGITVELHLPPALPGYPPADVKRLAEAETMLQEARAAFAKGRFQPAAETLTKLQSFYGDLRFVKGRAEGISAVHALARYRTLGLSGLFHATKVTRRGKRHVLRYDFKTDAEMLDWEPMQLLAHQDDGKFERSPTGVQGSGVAWLIHRGFFDGPTTIRCKARANQQKAHGLVLCQEGNETRHLLWLISNHWLVEGENYVKARPGHSVLMFGKGVNRDVPVESPEVGFIFRGASLSKPQPNQSEVVTLSFGWAKNRMKGVIRTRYGEGEREDVATGDDGRGMSRLRPGLMVVQNAVTFREVEIEGRLHKEYEKKRVNELLELAALLD